jgi:NTE family protein
MKRPALILTGGGARAAYQAGAIRGLAEIWPHRKSPFKVITGISAGSINASMLAHHSDDFLAGAEKLWALWNTLTIDRVFRTDSYSLIKMGSAVLRDLALGGFFPRPVTSHLLDTTPLRALIERNVDFERVKAHIKSGDLSAFAVTATNYHTGCAVTFFDADAGIGEWVRNNHLGWRQDLRSDHILASSSIPVFFPPVQLGEGAHFGDGTVRLLAPLSPALRMGATSLLAVGVRKPKDPAHLAEQNLRPGRQITFADIAGVLLNAVFLDTLETDIERLQRFNRTLHGMEPAARAALETNWRIVESESLQPSRDLGLGASGMSERYPLVLRHLLRGLGVDRRRGSDVSSYLAFDYHYTGKLLRIGYNDVMDRRDQLRQFMLHHAST